MSHVIDRIIKLCREKGYNYGTVDDDKVVILAKHLKAYDEVMSVVNDGNDRADVAKWRTKGGMVVITVCFIS